jgi:hypothetical protein
VQNFGLTELVRNALILTEKIGLKVCCIAFYGTSANVTNFKLLGSIFVQNEGIHWKFFKHFNELQRNHGIELSNELTPPITSSMKVDLVAQTLSTSVADAINFLNIAERDPRFPQHCEATFIHNVDQPGLHHGAS